MLFVVRQKKSILCSLRTRPAKHGGDLGGERVTCRDVDLLRLSSPLLSSFFPSVRSKFMSEALTFAVPLYCSRRAAPFAA